jgi:Tfp pilus assembly protein PilX
MEQQRIRDNLIQPLRRLCRMQGMSLVEFMIAITVGTFITLGILILMSRTSRSYKIDDEYTRMQEAGTSALNYLGNDIHLAGYYGLAANTTVINTLAVNHGPGVLDYNAIAVATWTGTVAGPGLANADCGAANWSLQTGVPVSGLPPGTTAAQANAALPCIPFSTALVNNYVTGPALVLRGASGLLANNNGTGGPGPVGGAGPPPGATLDNGTLYVQSDPANGFVFQGVDYVNSFQAKSYSRTVPNAGGGFVDAPIFPYQSNIYYIRPCSRPAGGNDAWGNPTCQGAGKDDEPNPDPIPTLVRQQWQSKGGAPALNELHRYRAASASASATDDAHPRRLLYPQRLPVAAGRCRGCVYDRRAGAGRPDSRHRSRRGAVERSDCDQDLCAGAFAGADRRLRRFPKNLRPRRRRHFQLQDRDHDRRARLDCRCGPSHAGRRLQLPPPRVFGVVRGKKPCRAQGGQPAVTAMRTTPAVGAVTWVRGCPGRNTLPGAGTAAIKPEERMHSARTFSSGPARRQHGAVLVIGLVMLTVMTLLVVSMMKTSMIDLKIGGVSQDNLINVSNADVILNTYFNDYTGKLSASCITQPLATSCSPATAGSGWTAPAFSGSNAPASWGTGGNNLPVLLQMYCGDKPGFNGNQVGSGYQTVAIDISTGPVVSALGSQTRLHLGMSQDLAPGACSAT